MATQSAMTFGGSAGFRLRPYQQAAIDGVRRQLELGNRRTLTAMATGLGKTVVFASLPGALGLAGRWLVLAHRRELLEQAKAKLLSVNPGLTVEIEQAGRRAGAADVVVASVPTLQNGRLARLDPAEFAGVIVDEAHHAIASTYRKIFKHFGCNKGESRIPLLGFTATPKRGDSIGLAAVFDSVAYDMGIRAGIEQGWLAPLSGLRVSTGGSLDHVKWSKGDFAAGQLERAVDNAGRNDLVVDQYQEHASGRRALAFCAGVEHAHHMSEAFEDHGIAAAAIDGKTPQDKRDAILRDFAADKLDVVTNCGVLTEGFDDPGVNCILMARPTGSALLYQQIVGRGTRLAPGKDDCLVIDFVDASSKHRISTISTLFGLPEIDLRGRGAVEVKERIERIKRESPWADVDSIKGIEDLDVVTERIDFFNTAIPAELEGATRYQWRKSGIGYTISVPPGEESKLCRIDIVPQRLGGWSVIATASDGREHQVERSSLQGAVEWSDARIPAESKRLLDTESAWRKQPATAKQVAMLQRLGAQVPPGVSKGQASAAITMLLDQKRKKGAKS